MKRKNEEKIWQAVEKLTKPATATEIADMAKLSLPTTSKYLQILAAQGKIKIRHLGSVLLVLPSASDVGGASS